MISCPPFIQIHSNFFLRWEPEKRDSIHRTEISKEEPDDDGEQSLVRSFEWKIEVNFIEEDLPRIKEPKPQQNATGDLNAVSPPVFCHQVQVLLFLLVDDFYLRWDSIPLIRETMGMSTCWTTNKFSLPPPCFWALLRSLVALKRRRSRGNFHFRYHNKRPGLWIEGASIKSAVEVNVDWSSAKGSIRWRLCWKLQIGFLVLLFYTSGGLS